MNQARHGSRRCAAQKLALDPRHGGGKVLGAARPARGINARRAVQGFDAEAGIVGQRRPARAARGGESFQLGVGLERVAGLFGLRQAERRRR